MPNYARSEYVTDFILYATAGALLLLGAWLAYRALWLDRARGRRRCPRCWYDMRGTPGLRCSECGRIATSERQLRRTRRYPRLARLSLLVVLLGVAGLATPTVREHGWTGFVPTIVLIAMSQSAEAPFDSQAQHWTTKPLVERVRKRRVAGWEWAYWLRWKHVLRTRERWPAGVPLVGVAELPPGMVTYPELRGAFEGACPVRCHHSLDVHGVPAWSSLGIPLAANDPVRVRFTIPHIRGVPEHAIFGEYSLPVQVMRTMDEVLLPVSGAGIDAAMRESLSIRLIRISDSCGYLQVGFTRHTQLADVGLGITIDVLKNDVVVSKFRLGPEPGPLNTNQVYDLGPLPIDDQTCEGIGRRVRIRGDAEMALRDFACSRYWAGEFELPLADIVVDP